MNVRLATVAALLIALFAAVAPAAAQTTPPAPDAGWRTVAPENLLVIDTPKGRILVELEPRMAPLSVARIRTLADQGFYDGLTFHRVLEGSWPRPAIRWAPGPAAVNCRTSRASSSSDAGGIWASSIWRPARRASWASPAPCRSSPSRTRR